MQRPFKASGASSTVHSRGPHAAPRLRSRAPLPRAAHVCPRHGFVAQLAEQPPLKRTDRVRLSTKPLGAKAPVRAQLCALGSLTIRKDVPTTRDGARRGWALLDALPGGEAETQAAVNRPTAGSNPALAARLVSLSWESTAFVTRTRRVRLPRPALRRARLPARSALFQGAGAGSTPARGTKHPSTADPVTALR